MAYACEVYEGLSGLSGKKKKKRRWRRILKVAAITAGVAAVGAAIVMTGGAAAPLALGAKKLVGGVAAPAAGKITDTLISKGIPTATAVMMEKRMLEGKMPVPIDVATQVGPILPLQKNQSSGVWEIITRDPIIPIALVGVGVVMIVLLLRK
jgi:hypothetical protein